MNNTPLRTLPTDNNRKYSCAPSTAIPEKPRTEKQPRKFREGKIRRAKHHLATPATLNKKIPTLDITLTSASTYPQWISSLEDYLFLLDVPRTEHQVWDVVTGNYKKPDEDNKREYKQWREANVVALLTIKKNCDEEVRARIGGFREAKEAYEELKKAYEGKSVTELGALMKSVTRMHFDDRKTTIQDHIAEYGRAWNSFVAITARLDLTNDKGFGTGLQHIAKGELAKVEFLLDSLPPFYSNTVENIKSKDISYDDVIRKLIQYIPQRQKGRRTDGGGSKDDPVVLKADKKTLDTSKQCTYCQKTKGWKGIGHTKEECRTYKKEKKEKAKAKKAKAKEEKDESSDSDTEGVSVCMIKIGKAKTRKGWFQYDTETSHHTTNDLSLLKNVQNVSLPVEAHDGSIHTCHKQGTLKITHNGKTIEHPDCLYDPSFSNLVSGQRLRDHGIKARGTTATIKIGNQVVYTAERDKQVDKGWKCIRQRYNHGSPPKVRTHFIYYYPFPA